MKRLVTILPVLFSITSVAGPLDPLVFLQGCWGSTNHSNFRMTEDWYKSADNSMLGIGQEINPENQLVNHEFLRISYSPISKNISYHPIANGQPMSFFTYDLKESVAGEKAVFLNPYNDFPKSIAYEIRKETLTVTLRGEGENGEPVYTRYELEKEDCTTRFPIQD